MSQKRTEPRTRLIGWLCPNYDKDDSTTVIRHSDLSRKGAQSRPYGMACFSPKNTKSFPISSLVKKDLDLMTVRGFPVYFRIEAIDGVDHAVDVEIISENECGRLNLRHVNYKVGSS